ncbi:hypothetical protein Tco_0554221, partial [Tanacetum coccineum]
MLKPLPTIDPKDKGKGVLNESPTTNGREREIYTIEERSKLLAEFFERRKKLLAEERAAAVRNKPPTRTQLRSPIHQGTRKRCRFCAERDEKMIDKMNKKVASMDEEEVPEEAESTKVEVKQEGREENIRKRSEEQLKASLKIVLDEEEEIDYEVLGT